MQVTQEQENPKQETRKVSDGPLNMRSEPGTSTEVIGKLPKGTEVTYTGKITEEKDGHVWAEVTYDGKTGWVAVEYLEEVEYQHDAQSVANSKTNQNTNNETNKDESKMDLTNHEELQKAFQNVNSSSSDPGDFDGRHGLQCVDIVKWFIDTYTTLTPANGNGCNQVGAIAAQKEDLEVSIIPSAPAIYSVAAGSPGPGLLDLSHGTAGHTGIILSCKKIDETHYEITYLHTYNSLKDETTNSSIRTEIVTPNKDVTYVNIGNYIK